MTAFRETIRLPEFERDLKGLRRRFRLIASPYLKGGKAGLTSASPICIL